MIADKLAPLTDDERAYAQEHADVARKELIEEIPDFPRRLNAIVSSPEPVRVNLRKLSSLAGRVSKLTTPHSACKNGCAHCCHIAVAIAEPEAAMIGQAIGRKPSKPKQWMYGKYDYERVEFGYGNPCPFLADGRCSIYEHRPIACRTHFHMGPDAQPCELDKPREVAEYALRFFDEAVAIISRVGRFADIRDFFPRGAAK